MRMGRQWNLLMFLCSVECSCPANRELVVGRLNFSEVGCEDGRMIELAQDCVQCWM
jgi:hypothetical protein